MFSIPAIPPTINNCKFINVSYMLEVSIATPVNLDCILISHVRPSGVVILRPLLNFLVVRLLVAQPDIGDKFLSY